MARIKTRVLLPLVLVSVALGQDSADRVIREALKPSPLEFNLRQLTDEIGGRVPGTPAMQRAVEWATQGFKAAGTDTVHSENFTIPVSWAEGATQMSVGAAPAKGGGPGEGGTPLVEFKVRAVSIAWAPPLPPVHHVPIVDVGMGTEEEFARAGNIADKVILVHTELLQTWADLFDEYLQASGVVDAAANGKAMAVAFMATRKHDLLYRHTNATGGELDRIPSVLIAREEGERIARLLASGHVVWADLTIPNQIGGPIRAANVVAEIGGSEKPDEFVVLGAHLDSWELGTGALDNGCNAALVIDALRAIKASGQRPRRSIRFILFSGEEQGMIGSRAYVVAHRKELDNAAGVVIFDAGVGRTTGFSLGGRKDVVEAVTQLASPLKQFDAAVLTTDAEWGTDNFDFMLEGVPTLVANQEEANYLVNYHASSDTYDKVDMAQLKKHVAEAAALTFAIANARGRLGPRLKRAQIEQTMRETHLDEQLKTFGIWQQWESGERGREK